MLRGYDGNMLNLEPSYLMSFVILVQMAGCTLISYYQTIKGPFFFIPSHFLPGWRKMIIPLSKVPEDKLLEDCSICYQVLILDPMADNNQIELHELDSRRSLKERLLEKSRKVMVTPCLHYFHTGCLTSWIEKKQECPLCKTKLNYF